MKSFVLQREHRLTIGWFFATAVGFVLGEVFLTRFAFRFVPLSLVQSEFDWFGIMLGTASGIATGLAVGVLQWLILRNYINQSLLWIVATPLGMASGFFIGRLIITLERQYLSAYIATTGVWDIFWTLSFWVSLFLEGVVIGFIQLFVIEKSLPKPRIWVIGTGVGWALANVIEHDVLRPMFYPCCFDYIYGPIIESILYAFVGIFLGIITGVLLLWLMRQKNLMVQSAA